jgi:hypothetical protein
MGGGIPLWRAKRERDQRKGFAIGVFEARSFSR